MVKQETNSPNIGFSEPGLLSPESKEEQKELRIFLALDLDGTLYKGPGSWGEIFKALAGKGTSSPALPSELPVTENSSQKRNIFEQAANKLVAWTHRIRRPTSGAGNALSALREQEKTNHHSIQMAVVSGRKHSQMKDLTLTELERDSLLPFFEDGNSLHINLKPEGMKSWEWKCVNLIEALDNGHDMAILFDNDPITAKNIALLAKEHNLPIYVFLHKGRTETHPALLKRIGLHFDRETSKCRDLPITLVGMDDISLRLEELVSNQFSEATTVEDGNTDLF